MGDIQLLRERIKVLQAKRQRLLHMKKEQRGNELHETEDAINRLESWCRELSFDFVAKLKRGTRKEFCQFEVLPCIYPVCPCAGQLQGICRELPGSIKTPDSKDIDFRYRQDTRIKGESAFPTYKKILGIPEGKFVVESEETIGIGEKRYVGTLEPGMEAGEVCNRDGCPGAAHS